jgi:hypothetical protein
MTTPSARCPKWQPLLERLYMCKCRANWEESGQKITKETKEAGAKDRRTGAGNQEPGVWQGFC